MAFTTKWSPAGPYVTFTGNDGSSGNVGNGASASTPLAELRAGINASRSQAAAGVASGQNGVQAILNGKPNVDRAVGDMRNAANAMLPIADTMRGEGDALFDSGTKVTEQALATLGTGLGFINMDEGASPLVAKSIELFRGIDPDRYVAGAAQDVQSQFDNASAQGERELARRGVSPTSGAALALNDQRNRALAVARASAMTRARERGINDQASAFQSLLANNANTFLQTGGQLASIGSSAQAQAANAKKGAASVLGESGDLAGRAGALGLDFGRALSSAWNALAGTQLNQAKNTNDTEAVRVSAVNGGSARGGGSVGGRAVGGVNVTQAPEDDWFNWKGTGHSEGWNKNNNPDFLTLLNNGQ